MITFICYAVAFKLGMDAPWGIYFMTAFTDFGLYEFLSKRKVYFNDYLNRKRGAE